jgi:hypothetical protein
LDIKVNAAWFLVSQESLTKKLLSKYKSGRYWDNMIKRILALTIVLTLMISFLPSIFLTELASANPLNFPIPSMKIVSPPPKLQRIYYSLDGGPSVYFDFTTLRNSSWWPDKIGYVVGAKVDLEKLSEGSHNVNAYSVDSDGKVIASSSRTFTVDSQYQVTVVEILSPKNITYSTREIPLIFTVNGEFKNASYHFLPPSPVRGNITGFPITGNTTLTGLTDGFYRILFWTFADGKGGDMTNLEFTLNLTQANNSLTIDTQTIIIVTASTGTIVVGLVLVAIIYFKRNRASK